MPHSFGYRARTRHMFKRGFKGTYQSFRLSPLLTFCLTEHGPIKTSTFLINYHVGDIVDIKANAAQQKGMPHKYYHGFVSKINALVNALSDTFLFLLDVQALSITLLHRLSALLSTRLSETDISKNE